MLAAILILLLIVLGMAAYFFFAPFYVEINSSLGLYRFRFHRLASASFVIMPQPAFVLRVAGWQKTMPLTALAGPHNTEPRSQQKPARSNRVTLRQLQAVLKSFKVNRCIINMDLGNMQLNGMAYPLFAWLSWYSGRHIAINFTGTTEVVLEVQNSIAPNELGMVKLNNQNRPFRT